MHKIKKIIREEKFYPKFWGLFTNPYYFSRKGLANNLQKFGCRIKGTTLDVGCGTKPYENLFSSSIYIGLEINSHEKYGYANKTDVSYDGRKFPFPNNSFDSVVTNQVLEHVFQPNAFLKEINRVICDGGLLLLSIPFIWDEHEQPWNYARYSSFGLNHLLQKHGFETIEHCKSVGDISLIFQLLNAYTFKKTLTNNPYLNYFILFCFIAPFNILGTLLSRILPSNNDLYLDNIVVARKIVTNNCLYESKGAFHESTVY